MTYRLLSHSATDDGPRRSSCSWAALAAHCTRRRTSNFTCWLATAFAEVRASYLATTLATRLAGPCAAVVAVVAVAFFFTSAITVFGRGHFGSPVVLWVPLKSFPYVATYCVEQAVCQRTSLHCRSLLGSPPTLLPIVRWDNSRRDGSLSSTRRVEPDPRSRAMGKQVRCPTFGDCEKICFGYQFRPPDRPGFCKRPLSQFRPQPCSRPRTVGTRVRTPTQRPRTATS